jgi:hypothetical protein
MRNGTRFFTDLHHLTHNRRNFIRILIKGTRDRSSFLYFFCSSENDLRIDMIADDVACDHECFHHGDAASEKGRSKGWAALGVAFWLGGELMGAIVGGLLGLDSLALYGVALLMAAAGVLVAYLVVKALPPQASGSLGPAA